MLFVALVVVFDRGHHGKPWQFFLSGYGIPLLLTGITVGTAAIKGDTYDGYFREDACWLDGGYLWAFIGPVAVVLIFNTVILFKAMMEAYRVNQQRNGGEEDERWTNIKSTLRNFLLLSYMLGITWAFGYFNTFGRPSQYIFVFLNATTGVVVLAQTILFNKKMRDASIAKVWKSRSASTRSTKLSAPSDPSAERRRVSKAISLNFNGQKLVSANSKNKRY